MSFHFEDGILTRICGLLSLPINKSISPHERAISNCIVGTDQSFKTKVAHNIFDNWRGFLSAMNILESMQRLGPLGGLHLKFKTFNFTIHFQVSVQL